MPKSNPAAQGMHPEDIIAELRKRKITMSGLAVELNCSATSIRLVIHSKQQSKRIADTVAKKIDKKTSELFPGQYNYKGRKPFKQTLKGSQVAA